MIKVEEAIAIIEANSLKMPKQTIAVTKALGYVLAEKVISPINMPPFRQSAMDGYAFTHSIRHQYDIIGTSQAGDHLNIKLKNTEAVRIFTGAFVPDNADTVVMQEHVMANKEDYSSAIVKKANFAKNFAKQMGGPVEGEVLDVSPEQLEALRQQGYQFEIM